MARARHLGVGLCLVAIFLLGGGAARMSLAEEAPAKSEHQPAPESKGQSAAEGEGGKGEHGRGERGRGEHGGGEGAPTRDAHSPNPTVQETDRTDMRTNTEPYAPLSRREGDRGQLPKLKSFRYGNARQHRWSVGHASEPAVRNAIGVAVPPQETATHLDGHVSPGIVQMPPGSPGVSPATGIGIPRPGGPTPNRLTHVPVPPVVISPAARAGTISGTGLVRRGSGPSQVGGPAKSVAVISGTTIKLKR